MQVKFIKPYTTRIRSFRGWVLVVQGIWVLWMNAWILIYNIVAAVVFVILWLLVALPARAIVGTKNSIHNRRIERAKDRMQDYVDGR